MILFIPGKNDVGPDGLDSSDLSHFLDKETKVKPVVVKIRREPFSDIFTFSVDNFSEDVECGPEAFKWFQERGANMEVVEKALDYAYNFYNAEVVINRPNPVIPKDRLKPKI